MIVQVIGENRFDFVLGSLHKTRKYGDMMMLNYAHPALDLQDVFRSYYEELLEVVQWGHFDSLAHLGYPLRYLKPYNRTVDLAQIDDVFAEIMKSLVAQGKALELNTGGLRMEIEAFTPSMPNAATTSAATSRPAWNCSRASASNTLLFTRTVSRLCCGCSDPGGPQ